MTGKNGNRLDRASATFVVTPLALAATLAACAPTTMAVPQALAGSADRLPVERPKMQSALVDEDWRLGAYAVTVDRGGKRTSGAGVGAFSASKSAQAFKFTVDGAGPERSAECTVSESSKGIGGFSKNSRTMSCALAGESTDPWSLELGAEQASEGVVGVITAGEQKYEIVPIHETEQGQRLSSAAGYVFRGEAGEKGAVDVNGSGIVYLARGLPEAEAGALICASVALMLYEDSAGGF
jgi:hypothetical protein